MHESTSLTCFTVKSHQCFFAATGIFTGMTLAVLDHTIALATASSIVNNISETALIFVLAMGDKKVNIENMNYSDTKNHFKKLSEVKNQ